MQQHQAWMMQQQQYTQQHQAWMMQQQQLQYQQQQLYPQVGSQPGAADEIRTLWIGDLQYWMDENYIFNCFAPIGEVVAVKLIRNKQTGQSEGYGFIDFTTRAGAEKALQTYNGKLMPNVEQNFRLNWASFGSCEKRRRDDTPDYTIFVGDLASDVTDHILQETFKTHYTSVKGAKVIIDRLSGRAKGFGFVRFGDEAEQQRAMTEMNGMYCSSRPMRIGVATNKQATDGQQQPPYPKGRFINEASSEFHFDTRAVTSFSSMKPKTEKPDEAIEMNLCNEISIKLMLTNINTSYSDQKNIVSSPMSINILLNMLANGYGEGSMGRIKLMDALGSRTIDEINHVSSNLMKLITSDSDEDPSHEDVDNKRRHPPPSIFDLMYGDDTSYGKPSVVMANGVWADHARSFKPQFVEIATRVYQSCPETLDFSEKKAVVEKVNSWAEQRTNGLIKDLISEGCVLKDGAILANSLYFKAAWAKEFSEYTTQLEMFDLLDGTSINVPFMKSSEYQYYRSLDGFKVLRLPYRSARGETRSMFSMYLFLPDVKNGLKPLLERFKQDPSLIHTKCESTENCITWIPKFTISFDFKPSDIMKTMGLDLSKMGGLSSMIDVPEGAEECVFKVIQNSYIEVNEKGTKAASVSCACYGAYGCGSPPPPPTARFVADHPFFFMVKDDVSGAALFSGIIINPSLS